MNENSYKKVLTVCVAAIALLFLSNIFLYGEIQRNDDGLDGVEKTLQSVVAIGGETDAINTNGTGFIIEQGGSIFVITCAHCVLTDDVLFERIYCTFYGSSVEYDLEVVKYDISADLALLEFIEDVDAPALKIGDSDKLRMGQHVYTIGNQAGMGLTFTSGFVSSPFFEMSTIDGSEITMSAIKMDMGVNHGNSGGPLMSQNNEVVGVVFSKMRGTQENPLESIGFAVPSKTLLEFLNDHNNAHFP